MGIIKDYMNQTRKPEGVLGKLMITGMNIGHASMAKWGTSHLDIAEPESVIDLGCGGGSNVKALAERYYKASVTGLDYSELSVLRSSAYNRKLIEKGRCTIVQGDVSKLDIPDESFDLATAFETVYFWPGLEKCFSEVARILKPGGTFMIVNESDGCDGPSKKYEQIIKGMKIYTLEEISDALVEAGFASVKTVHHDSKPWITVIAAKYGPVKENISLGAPGTEYANWMSSDAIKAVGGITAASVAGFALLRKPLLKAAAGILAAGSAYLFMDCLRLREAMSYDGGKAMDIMQRNLMDHLDWDGKGSALDVGCGSGTLTIRTAKTYPEAKVTGVDYWGMGWDYSKELCETNAAIEGVGDRCEFIHGDAKALDFPDETFDALVSNCVYSQIMGRGAGDKKQLLTESLRTLKKGGVFAIQDYFDRKKMFGDMEELTAYLKTQGISEIHYEGGQDAKLPEVVIKPYCISGTGILWGRK